jgi:hypothetical protein
MSKKITGADGKTYKVKKPFYKRVWFWILIVVVVIVAIAGMGGNGDKDSSSDKTSSSKTVSSSSSTKTDDGKIRLADYNAIKLGDLMKKAEGGSTVDELTKKFGKASDTSSNTLEGVKTDMYVWDNVDGSLGANLSVMFSDGKAVDKAISDLKVSRSSKITLAKFEGIANGKSEADLIKELGNPNGYSENLIDGKTTKMLMYTSGVKGDLGANCTFTLDNGAVSGKSQTSMK